MQIYIFFAFTQKANQKKNNQTAHNRHYRLIGHNNIVSAVNNFRINFQHRF
jgi:hypothetical protein